ncbi:RCC1/BLIP-II [Lojkania enalia]|uniref:RCC1/BLIP-II n=1 Tax=Lojkania enalia TaxID=147567 RepID=A0A9P4N2J0_9PLEO|nr:RCC1/BLIP-II [Didymosphaeria enalia]
MPPRRSARAESAKAAQPERRGRVRKAATSVTDIKHAVKKATGKQNASSTCFRTITNTPLGAPRGRPKKATPAVADKPAIGSKRKARDDADLQPVQKKNRTRETATKPAKLQPKGPLRRGGKKTIVNELRYTKPLNVFVFGEGGSGELGLGSTKKAIDVKRPRLNEALTNMGVVKVATGGMHVVALTKDNKILTWGVNDNGALGRDTSNAPVKMKDIDEDKDSSDSDSDDDDPGLNEYEATPTAISEEHFPENTVFVDIAAGDSCSFFLTSEGAVYGCGTFRRNEGVLGFAKGIETARTPVYIDGLKKITQIACGTNHVLALDVDNHVWAWGNGQQNQLGRRMTERGIIEGLVPTRVGFNDHSIRRPSKRIAKISCGDYHAFAIAEDGHVWSWGANNYGETAHTGNAGEDNASVSTARVAQALEGCKVVSIEGGLHHNLAVTSEGEVLVWGRCDGSQTGLRMDELNAIEDEEVLLKTETTNKPKILIRPTAVPNLKNIATAATGPEHSIVIDTNGKAYSWGFSANYQTGQGTDDDIEVPTLIDNSAVRDQKLVWAGAGGQYSMLASTN